VDEDSLARFEPASQIASEFPNPRSCRQQRDAIARATIAKGHAGMYALHLWPQRPGCRDGFRRVIRTGSTGGHTDAARTWEETCVESPAASDEEESSCPFFADWDCSPAGKQKRADGLRATIPPDVATKVDGVAVADYTLCICKLAATTRKPQVRIEFGRGGVSPGKWAPGGDVDGPHHLRERRPHPLLLYAVHGVRASARAALPGGREQQFGRGNRRTGNTLR
jgi:hypothetical protein